MNEEKKGKTSNFQLHFCGFCMLPFSGKDLLNEHQEVCSEKEKAGEAANANPHYKVDLLQGNSGVSKVTLPNNETLLVDDDEEYKSMYMQVDEFGARCFICADFAKSAFELKTHMKEHSKETLEAMVTTVSALFDQLFSFRHDGQSSTCRVCRNHCHFCEMN